MLRESFFCGRSSGFSALERSKDVCLAPEDAQLTVSLIGLSLNTDNVLKEEEEVEMGYKV